MRVVYGTLLLICISILPAGCGKPSQPPPRPAFDVSTPEAVRKLLPPPGESGAPGTPGTAPAPQQ
jgi:hypothetical protein